MKQNLLIIIITFVATVTMVFFSGKISSYGIKDVALVITSFLSFLAVITGIIAFYRTEKNLLLAHDNIEKLNQIKVSYQELIPRNKLKWLYSDKQLLNVEKRKINTREIWIVSPDPSDDTGDSPWVKVIDNNIKDGIRYYYFSPDSDSLTGAIKGLKTVFRDHLDKCYIHKLQCSEYESLPHEHLVIYDPHNEYNETDSYAELEVDEKGWWMRLPNNRKNKLLGKLEMFVERAKPLNEY